MLKIKKIDLKKVVKIKFFKHPNKIIRRRLKEQIYKTMVKGEDIDKYLGSLIGIEIVMEIMEDFEKINCFVEKNKNEE